MPATSPTGSRARAPTPGIPATSCSCRCATPTAICWGSSRSASPRSGLRPSAADLAGLVAVADHAALALQSAHETAAAAFHRAALRQLLQVSSRLTETLSAGAILQSVCEGISVALGFDKVCIDLPDPVSGVFTTRAATGWTLEDMRQNSPMTLWELAPLLDPPFERQGCYLLTLEEALARLPERLSMRHSEKNGRGPLAWNRHWLTVPMYDREGNVIGLIWADDPRNRLLPSTELLQALRVFANQATAALDSAARFEEMRFLAEHDPLTRLYNRRAFNHRLRVEAARSRRYGKPFALVVLDVDGFKSINDRHGHMAGDSALARVADLLSHELRGPDAAFRIGGDEFALILPEIEVESIDAVVSRIATHLERRLRRRRACGHRQLRGGGVRRRRPRSRRAPARGRRGHVRRQAVGAARPPGRVRPRAGSPELV